MSSICDNCKNIISCNNPRKSNPLLLSCQEQKTITNTEFAIVELEKIKAEMEKDKIILFYAPQKVEIFNEWIEKLDKRIAELKGE